MAEHEFRILPVTESISHMAAALMEQHAPGDGLGLADALIAATARDSGLVLATGNFRHFRRIANLELKAFRPAAPRR
jgi:predicted nucleic acid-binding protein